VTERVQLRVRFASAGDSPDGDEGLSHEQLWATAVDAGPDSDTDTYRLESNSFSVPLAAGDLVRAGSDATGRLQVVDVVEPCDGVLTIFAPDATAAPDAVAALMDVWRMQGAGWTEHGGPFLATVWPGAPMDAVASQLNADQAAGRGEWILAAEPHERRREAQDEIEFGLS
jgi:hypothetical protein